MTDGVAEASIARGRAAVERARQVQPIVAAASNEIFAQGRLPERVVSAMCDTDLFRVLAPVSVGGGEVDLQSFAEIALTLGEADLSTGWCFVQAASAGHSIGPRLQPEASREIFGSPTTIVAGGTSFITSRADIVEGGYVVNGEWQFASGCQHSTWFDARVIVHRDGEPLRTSSGALAYSSMVVPRSQVEIVGPWDVVGMRGTGSHTYRITDVFVPERLAVPYSWSRPPATSSPLYQVPTISAAHIAFASNALGGAKAALADFTEIAAGKMPAYSRVATKDSGIAQGVLARARGKLLSALAFRDFAVAQVWAQAESGAVTPQARADLRLATVSGVETAVEVIDSLYHVAGTSGIFGDSPLQRRFQDIHVLAQQMFARASHFENVGKVLLGLPYDSGLL